MFFSSAQIIQHDTHYDICNYFVLLKEHRNILESTRSLIWAVFVLANGFFIGYDNETDDAQLDIIAHELLIKTTKKYRLLRLAIKLE